jgi:hypothetical protein
MALPPSLERPTLPALGTSAFQGASEYSPEGFVARIDPRLSPPLRIRPSTSTSSSFDIQQLCQFISRTDGIKSLDWVATKPAKYGSISLSRRATRQHQEVQDGRVLLAAVLFHTDFRSAFSHWCPRKCVWTCLRLGRKTQNQLSPGAFSAIFSCIIGGSV